MRIVDRFGRRSDPRHRFGGRNAILRHRIVAHRRDQSIARFEPGLPQHEDPEDRPVADGRVGVVELPNQGLELGGRAPPPTPPSPITRSSG